MILSRPPPPSDNNSNTGTATTRPRDMTLCSSYYYENENEDIVFEGKLGDTLAAHFLPPPDTPTPTLSSSLSMEWNKNKNSSGVSKVLSTRTSKVSEREKRERETYNACVYFPPFSYRSYSLC